MTTYRALMSLAAIALAAGACGSKSAGDSSAGSRPVAAPSSTENLVPTSQPPPDANDERFGTAATWTLDTSVEMTSASTTFTAMVTRLDCNNRVTGEVLDPVVNVEPDRIVITFSASSLDPTVTYTCPGNDAVAVAVNLDEPLGDRSLVDGACLGESAAARTSACEAGATRS